MRIQIFILRGTRDIFGLCQCSAAILPPGALQTNKSVRKTVERFCVRYVVK